MKAAVVVSLILAADAVAQPSPPPAGAGAAEAVASVELTLDAAVARAIAASPRLARLAAQERAASAQERGALAERWPQVDLSGGYQRHSDVPELSIGTDPTQPARRIVVFPNIPDNWRARAGVALPLYTGGRLTGQVKAAGQARVAAGEDLRAARADLVLETKTAYWSLVTAREGLRVLAEATEAYQAHLADARNRERFGLAARNEVLAVAVELDRVELDRLRTETAFELAQANLQRLLDLSPAVRVEPTEPLLPPQDAVELEPLVAEAASRPERKSLAARAAAASALARVERGARLPQLSLSGGYSYANPNREIVPPTAVWKDTWDVGFGVSWNVFDGGRRSAGERRAQAQADAAREQLRELDRAIRLEVTQRVLELRTAKARLAVAERGLASAAESLRVAGDRYREGVIPSSERLDAELAQERAWLARTEALAGLRLASAGLDRAVGR